MNPEIIRQIENEQLKDNILSLVLATPYACMLVLKRVTESVFRCSKVS